MKKLIYQCRSFHYLLNFDENSISQQIQGLTYFLYLTQLFNISGEFKPQSDIITIYSLIRGTFIFNIIDENYSTLIQILFLILNIILIISLCANLILNYIKNQKEWKLLIIIINLVINVYPNIFYIPIIWLNIKLCFTQSLMHFTIALINLSIAIFLTFLVIFFQRGDSLHQYENASNNIILIRILVKLFEFITIYFSFLNHTLTFIFQLMVLMSNISLNAFKFTEQSDLKVRQNLLFLVLNITLQTNLTFMDYLIISTVVQLFYTQLLNIKTQEILVKGDSILLCQLAEKIYKNCLIDKQARIQLQIFKNNHKCVKCKAFYDIIECILKRKGRNERDKLIYANFVQKKWPLRALVELHKEQNEDFYYQSALLTFQKLNISKIEIANYIYTAYKSQNVCQLIIDQLQKVMENLLKFWNETVMNQFDLLLFYQQSRRIGLEIKQLNLLFEKIYNLNNHKIWGSQTLDVISLRLQQVYYCVANVDLVKAQQMEEKINEVFRYEKYQQFMTIDSNQLVMNRSLQLRTSLIYNVNKLIKPNYQQMSQFLETSTEETSFIKSSLDLMPSFLANIHDQLTEAFIQKGQSHLSQQGQSTFCQNPKGYIVPCYIHILPIQGDNDYFINAILTKEQNYNESIIFGMNGRLYGMTQSYFEFTLQSLIFDNYSKRISINEIIEKGALIQYYIENIIEQIYNLKQNIEKHQNYTLNELVSYWQYPENHFNCVFSTNQIMRQQYSSNHVLSFSNFISQKTYLQISKPSTVQISEFEESLQNSKELNFDGCEWQILNNNYNNSIRQMLDQLGDSHKTNKGRIQLIYSLSFRKIQIGKKMFGYFILEIKDCKQDYTQKNTSNYFTSYQTRKSESSKINKSSYDFPVEDVEIINSERPQSNEEIENQIKHIKLKNHLLYLNKIEHDRQILFNNYLSSVSVTKQKMQSYDFENTSRLLKLQTDRQPKKQLLTTRIELQSINIQQDDDDIIQAVEQEFQEIIFERKVINQQEQDEDNNDQKKRDKYIKESNLKLKTKAQFELASNQTFKKKINILKDAFLYLDHISQSKFTLSCLKKFTYFSICVIFLLIINIVIESYEVQDHIQDNDTFIQNTLTQVEFHKSLAIKLNLHAIFKLSQLSIINQNQQIIQMAQTQAQSIYNQNIYNKEYQILNHYINDENLDIQQFHIIIEQFNNEMRQIYYNSTIFKFNFTNHTHYMFTYFYRTILQDLDNYKDQQPDLIQTLVFTILSFSFVIYQIRFLYEKQQVIIQILKLIQQTNILKIQNHIARLSIIKESFKIDQNQHYETNSKNWKLTSYISIVQEDPHLERQQNKKIHELEGNLNHRYIFPNCIVVTVLCLFILTGSVLQQNYYKDRFLDIEKSFIKLNLVLDSGLLYGTLIKTNRILDISDQLAQQIIIHFYDCMNLLIEISNDIIINLEYLQEDSILNLLISDYCLNYRDDIKYCYDDQYPYKEMHSLIDRGMMSLINNIEKVKITEFLFEFSNNQFENNPDELLNFLKSQTFINTFLVYFSETTNIFSQQLIEIYNFEYEYYSKYILVILFYEIAVGISVGLMYLLYGYLTQLYHKIDFQYIILFLKTMPYEQIQQKNFLHQMKIIMQGQ
ncbi:unnamed protein product [Paramecium pentaurelia]|uniref:Transmembrane protein n=1 Tax=Paramecium pentaurelia TaxID=43138 RepID=A0A8S1VTE7_9CILI|nr:unnamed protein product [Paramecium pentaurelia]